MTTPQELSDLANAVSSRAELYEFIRRLKTCPEIWENDNNNIVDYLEGMSGFVHDLDGWHKNRGDGGDAEVPSWAAFARILLAATIYE
jgi:hypothetical protein